MNAFEILEEETALLLKDPSGVGFEPPTWLLALEDEVRAVRRGLHGSEEHHLFEALLPTARLSIEDVQREIDQWDRPQTDD